MYNQVFQHWYFRIMLSSHGPMKLYLCKPVLGKAKHSTVSPYSSLLSLNRVVCPLFLCSIFNPSVVFFSLNITLTILSLNRLFCHLTLCSILTLLLCFFLKPYNSDFKPNILFLYLVFYLQLWCCVFSLNITILSLNRVFCHLTLCSILTLLLCFFLKPYNSVVTPSILSFNLVFYFNPSAVFFL